MSRQVCCQNRQVEQETAVLGGAIAIRSRCRNSSYFSPSLWCSRTATWAGTMPVTHPQLLTACFDKRPGLSHPCSDHSWEHSTTTSAPTSLSPTTTHVLESSANTEKMKTIFKSPIPCHQGWLFVPPGHVEWVISLMLAGSHGHFIQWFFLINIFETLSSCLFHSQLNKIVCSKLTQITSYTI